MCEVGVYGGCCAFVRCVLGDDRLGMRLRNCVDGACP